MNMVEPCTLRRAAEAVGPTYQITGEPSIKGLIRTAFTDLSKEYQDAWEWHMASEEERMLPEPKYSGSGLPGEQDTRDHLSYRPGHNA
jgi:hypothetical protein